MKGSLKVLLVASVVVLGGAACQNKKGPETASGLNRIHFDFDQASIRPDMIKILDGNAQYLKEHQNLKVVIEGHCDERGTNEYNMALGDRRAKSASHYLVTKGVSETSLQSASYGEERPVDLGHDESAWYKNRRGEFIKQ